jgi:hypothetical protein
MHPKPNHHPRKLLLTIARTTALLLCVLSTISFLILRINVPATFTLGTTFIIATQHISPPTPPPGTNIQVQHLTTFHAFVTDPPMYCPPNPSEFTILDIDLLIITCHP